MSCEFATASKFVAGVDDNADRMSQAGVRSLDHAKRRSVSIRIPRKHIDALAREAGDENLAVLRVQTHRVRASPDACAALESRESAAPRPGIAAKNQHGVSQRIGHHNFVMRGIIRQPMNGASQLGRLPRNHSDRRRIPVCQPGKYAIRGCVTQFGTSSSSRLES